MRSPLTAVLCIGAACVALAGCAASLGTEVHTLSDRPPTVASSYRVVLDDEQADDLEALRLSTRIEAELAQAGYLRAEDADLTVRFELYDDGPAGTRSPAATGVGASHGTSVASSQSSVAGVPVPLTRRSTVVHHHDFGVTAASGPERPGRRYRLELAFSDREGPSHKVTVTTTAAGNLRDLSSCLVEAAFAEFPGGDRQKREVAVRTKECAG